MLQNTGVTAVSVFVLLRDLELTDLLTKSESQTVIDDVDYKYENRKIIIELKHLLNKYYFGDYK